MDRLAQDDSRLIGTLGRPAAVAATASGRAPRRIAWIDIAKGFGITLVVTGHALRGLVDGGIMAATSATRSVDAWIYAFHMPLFFFLSGFLSYRSKTGGWLEFTGKRLRSIAYPYFLWSIITLGIKGELGHVVDHPYNISELPLIFYRPIDQFWFLYSLFLLSVIGAALRRMGAGPWTLVVIAFLVNPVILPLASSSIAIQSTRTMAIYFALGIALGSERSNATIAGAPVGLLTAIGAGSLFASCFAGWREFATLGPALALPGMISVVVLSVLLADLPLAGLPRLLGRYSLEIFLVHTIASAGCRIFLVRVLGVTDPMLHLSLAIALGLSAPIAVAVACRPLGSLFGFSAP